MARTKTTARLPPTRSHKGKRRRTSPSPERPIRNLFRDPKRQERYEQIKHWYFITERKVVLLPEEYDPFLNGLLRRNWMRLADPLPKFDLEIVREFYANAYPLDGLGDRRSKVRGRWVTYDRASISEFLGHPLPLVEGQLCDYTRRRRSQEAFDEEEVVNLICISNRSYRLGSSSDPRKILRTYMKTLAQDLTLDVATIIFEEIHKFVRYEVNKNNEKSKGALGFPALITALCQAQGVEVDLSVKIRPTITKRFIEKFCTNPAEIVPQLEQPAAVEQTPCPEQQPQLNIHDELLEQMRYLRLQMEHTCQQNISIHRGQLHLHEYLYNNVRGPYPSMTPPEFLAYL
ncbi:hypothetical protein LR48_Vigan10g186000 [Vigna angularis]|uniref:Putative plant transposon protein domain-containing protein n=1 Tax=Phaseolus angularis TaxID=3914 RepID=A0A0L9VLY1_PHAAN|nr:hypothetical protein LR48_Vigan10g186000 [Vigna angularis]